MKKILYVAALAILFSACSDEPLGLAEVASGEVLSGSYANMLTVGDFLYVLGNGQLQTLSIEDPSMPNLLNVVDIDFSIESLFISGENIFVGSPEGMFIYTIGADGIPSFRSQTSYDDFALISCFDDPISANEAYGYVTLDNDSAQANCWRPALDDQLQVYDLADLENPQLVNTIWMNNPKGVALAGEYLFVCEKVNGITAFELSNPEQPTEIYKSEDFNAYDLIPANGLLMVVGQDTLHQFDYSDIDNIIKIGTYSLRE